MITYLQRLTSERDSLTQAATELSEKAVGDDRDLTDTEQDSMRAWQTRCAQIDAQLTEFNTQAESARSYARLRDRLELDGDTRPAAPGERTKPAVETRSVGEQFVTSEQFLSYRGYGQSPSFEVEGFLETRAAITTTQLAVPHFVAAPIVPEFRSVLLGLVNHVTVSSGVVDWVLVGADPVAAVVAEGAAKPEAAVTLTPQTASLDTLAHWIQITRQALDDAAYIRSLLEGKLRRGILAKAEADLAAAIDAATTLTNAGAAGKPLMDSIRQGMGKVQAAGYAPNAVLLNPIDLATVDISSMTSPRDPNYWGLTPVASNGVTAGKAYVGDFRSGVTFFDRGVTSVFVTDSHASLFISNILVILAEARVKSVVDEPSAICECTVT